jgi:hypothetical protein
MTEVKRVDFTDSEEDVNAASKGNGQTIARFALPSGIAAGMASEKVLTTVAIRKPVRHVFVRVHPEHYFDTLLLKAKLDGPEEVYFVEPALLASLATHVEPTRLYLATTREADPFLWGIRLPGSDGRSCGWWDSAHTAASLARTTWVRVQANMSAGQYDVFRALGDLPEPEWPDLPFAELLEIATKGRIIDGPDHVILRRLRGEV